jgi:hypothetical protein
MTSEELALCQLAMMIFSDSLPRFDFVYLVTETRDNAMSGIKTAAAISLRNRVRRLGEKDIIVGIGGFNHPACYSPSATRKKLIEEKADMECVREIDYSDAPVGPNELHHTGTEMAMVSRFVGENDYRTVGLIAPPFHQLRSYLFLLTALHRAGRGQVTRVFNCPGVPLDWNQKATHSQGDLHDSRVALLSREIRNSLKYWRDGYLISPIEALDYFVLHRS